MREPLFRLVKADPDTKDDTLIGYQWIEVLAIVPCGANRLPPDEYHDHERWVYDSCFLCRTEHGITYIHENDLQPEMDDGVYIEARGVVVWDADSRTLKSVESTCVNGACLQLNVEEWGHDHQSCDCPECAKERVKAKRGARKASKKKATKKSA